MALRLGQARYRSFGARATLSMANRAEPRRTVDRLAATWLHVAMTRVKIAELKDHLSEHLRAVEGGREIEVMDRDRPIARIAPIPKDAPRIHVVPARRAGPPVRSGYCSKNDAIGESVYRLVGAASSRAGRAGRAQGMEARHAADLE
jgi:antitoxin (DNA-binding transcriptional repressor) of toxin-antitoxin stability system